MDNCVGKIIKRTTALIITAAILNNLIGCAKEPMENNNISSDIVSDSEDATGFDIERVRQSLVIKGETFELPK